MRKRKAFSSTILVLFLVQLIFGMSLSIEVRAEEDNSTVPQFMDVRKETVDFAYQYKNKTIVNNAVIFDNNIKLFIEENGQTNIVSDDFNLLRWLSFVGIYNDYAYLLSKQDDNKKIYKVDLNTYEIEFVKTAPTSDNGTSYALDYSIDSAGVLWVEAYEPNVPIYDSKGRIIDYNTKYVVYNDNGFYHETSLLQDGNSSYDRFGGLEKALDGSMWFSKSFNLGADNKVYQISTDNKIKEYTINSTNPIRFIYPGAENTLFVGTKELVKTQSGYAEGKTIIQKYKINNDALELVKEFDFEQGYLYTSLDSNGNLWINQSGVISKLEGEQFEKRYIVDSSLKALNVYDDNHLVACGIVGLGYTPISIEAPSEKPTNNTNTDEDSNTNTNTDTNTSSNTNTNSNTTNADNTNSTDSTTDINNENTNSENTDTNTSSNTNTNSNTTNTHNTNSTDSNIDINNTNTSTNTNTNNANTDTYTETNTLSDDFVQKTTTSEKFTININNAKEAVLTLNSNQILKDSVNEISPILPNGVQSVQIKIESEAINGGNGSLKVNTNNMILELPYSTIDFNGTSEKDFVSLKQNVVLQDESLSELKSIGKIFEFNLSTHKQDETKINDIHTFKSGKAKISVKLTDEDIKELDTTKLSAFYYNENTKSWENVGGSYNKETMTFDFETNHFSKYTIAQVNDTLPQKGSIINFTNLMLLTLVFILILTSIFILIRKRKLK